MKPEFNNLDELKQRLMPALKIRARELNKNNYRVTTEDLWEYFIYIWHKKKNLTLADLVDDVLNKKI